MEEGEVENIGRRGKGLWEEGGEGGNVGGRVWE